MKPKEGLTHPTVGISGMMFKYLNKFSLHLSFLLSSLCWLYSYSPQTSTVGNMVYMVGNRTMNKSPISHLKILLLEEDYFFFLGAV